MNNKEKLRHIVRTIINNGTLIPEETYLDELETYINKVRDEAVREFVEYFEGSTAVISPVVCQIYDRGFDIEDEMVNHEGSDYVIQLVGDVAKEYLQSTKEKDEKPTNI